MGGRIWKYVVGCVLAAVSQLVFAQAGKVESVTLPGDIALPAAIKPALNADGYRVVLDDGSVVCEIWLRKTVPAQPKKDVSSVLYPELAEGVLVGLISFSHATTDYRGEAIQAGTYTLRYALLPNDGNHLGVAPHRDFLLLVPAASDTDPQATFTFDELMRLSRKSTGTAHPGPLSMVRAARGTAAVVTQDDEDHCILSVTVKLASGDDLRVGLVVKGTVPE